MSLDGRDLLRADLVLLGQSFDAFEVDAVVLERIDDELARPDVLDLLLPSCIFACSLVAVLNPDFELPLLVSLLLDAVHFKLLLDFLLASFLLQACMVLGLFAFVDAPHLAVVVIQILHPLPLKYLLTKLLVPFHQLRLPFLETALLFLEHSVPIPEDILSFAVVLSYFFKQDLAADLLPLGHPDV